MRRVRLKHVADITAGQSPESANVTYSSDGLPFLQGCAEFGAKFPTSEKYCLNPPKTARKGSWLISVRAPVGSINLADQDYCIGRGLAAVYPDAADQGYLGYVLLNQSGFLNAISTGSTFQAISTFQLKNVEIELPPLDTQRRIARFLDEKTARIDGLIEKKRALLDRLAEKRQALITRAVTKGLNPDAPMKPSGIDWLGDIPAHWEVRQLKRLVDDGIGLQMGPFGGMLTNLPDYETGFKLYGQENTISGDFARGSRWVEEERYQELRRYELLIGDLVITRKGSLGNCRRVPEGIVPGIADSDTIRIRPNRARLLPEWALTLLHEAHFVSEQIAAHRRGAILSGLNTAVVGGLIFTVPPVAEQRELMKDLDALLSPIDTIAKRIRETIDKLAEYRSAFITSVVTGQIAKLG